MKIIVTVVLFLSMQFSYAINPARYTARALASSDIVLRRCGRTAGQIGFVAVLSALIIQQNNR